MNGSTFEGNDIVEIMTYEGDGVYSYEFDMGEGSGSFTPLIHARAFGDMTVHRFFAGSDLRVPDVSDTISELDLSGVNLTIAGQPSEFNNTFIFPFMLIHGTGGTLPIEVDYNNCLELRINGQVFVPEEPDCAQTKDVSLPSFLFEFEAGKRYHVEAIYRQVEAPSNLVLSGPSGLTRRNLFPFRLANTWKGKIFQNSAQNITFPAPVATPPAASSTPVVTEDEIVNIALLTVSSVVGVAGVLSVLMMLKGTSSVASYSLIQNLQMLILTPLIGVTIGTDVQDFYESMDFMMLNFNFLTEDVVFTDFNRRNLGTNFFQSNQYLSSIGLKSGSAIHNLGQLVTVCLAICFISMCVLLLGLMCVKSDSRVGRFSKWLSQFWFFSFHIRFFTLTSTFVLLAVFSEITISNDGVEHLTSYIVAWAIFVFYLSAAV